MRAPVPSADALLLSGVYLVHCDCLSGCSCDASETANEAAAATARTTIRIRTDGRLSLVHTALGTRAAVSASIASIKPTPNQADYDRRQHDDRQHDDPQLGSAVAVPIDEHQRNRWDGS